MALLEVKNLEVCYGVIRALKGINFEVNQGEIVSLIGANGAGKTTTMQSIMGLIPIKSGTVTYDGQVINKIPGHKLVSLGMSQVPEGRRTTLPPTGQRSALTPNIACKNSSLGAPWGSSG